MMSRVRSRGSRVLLTALAAFLLDSRPSTLDAQSRIAGGVVQSDEWIIRRDVKEEEFNGNVRFDHGNDHVRADWALYKRLSEIWTVRGRMYTSRTTPKGELLEFWGHRAIYDMKSKDATADGGKAPLRFRRTFTVDGSTVVWNGTAGSARYDGASKTGFLEGGVEVTGDDLGIKSRTARFDQAKREGAFEGGRPVALFGEKKFLSTLQADTIHLQDDPRRVTASGNVRGWLVLRKKDGTSR